MEIGNRKSATGTAAGLRRCGFRPPASAGGFTLIELVAAFVVFALAFSVLMSILSDSMHNTRQSADYTRAALMAQSLLDPLGVGEPLREGASNGKFDDKYSWRLNIAKIDPPEPLPALGAAAAAPAPGNANGKGPVITQMGNNIDLFQIELVVTWGTYYMTHNARFVTLRAVAQEAPNLYNPPPTPATPGR